MYRSGRISYSKRTHMHKYVSRIRFLAKKNSGFFFRKTSRMCVINNQYALFEIGVRILKRGLKHKKLHLLEKMFTNTASTIVCVHMRVCVCVCVYLGRKKVKRNFILLSSWRISGSLKYLKGFSTFLFLYSPDCCTLLATHKNG